jgi:formate hydrogenlyase transcriptional activator
MKLAAARGIKSGCAVPLISHDKIVGSMALASLREAAFTENDVELLTQIGVQAAIAVENAINFENARTAQRQMARERDRSKLLLEVNNAVVSHLNLTQLLKSITAKLSSHSSRFSLHQPVFFGRHAVANSGAGFGKA